MAIRTYRGTTPQLGPRAFVDASAVVLGDVVLGEDASVWPMAVVRGDMHRIRIGKRKPHHIVCILYGCGREHFEPRDMGIPSL